MSKEMAHCFIISDRKEFITELECFLKEKTNIQPVFIHLKSAKDKIAIFEIVCDTIQEYSQVSLRQSVVVVDEILQVKSDELNPLAIGKEHVYAMLMLAFPEMQFTYLNHSGLFGKDENHPIHFSAWLKNAETHQMDDSALFDPYGFRNIIRETVKEKGVHLRTRKELALSIDDEEPYALFHAYTAYKMGYRCAPITQMRQLENKSKTMSGGAAIQFEDIFLNFPDRGETTHFSDLRKRDGEGNYPLLKKAEKRFLITVGHNNSHNHKDNREYIRELKLTGKTIQVLHKPSAGIYDVMNQCKLMKQYRRDRKEELNHSTRSQHVEGDSHSSPGVLLMIAERLLLRANALLNEVSSVADAVHGAVLCMEAKELLGGRTPTVSISALALQHQAEVTAESMFFGVEYNLRLTDRFEDIDTEIGAISKWFGDKTRKRQETNANLQIMEILAQTFSNFNQFNEELLCLEEARRLKFKIWRQHHPINILALPVHKYIEQSLHSIQRFLFIVLSWVLAFGFIYFHMCGDPLSLDSALNALAASSHFFFTLQPMYGWEDVFTGYSGGFILAFQGILSLFNLTLILSHLYLLIIRR